MKPHIVHISVCLFAILWNVGYVYGLVEGLYCGLENCYDGKSRFDYPRMPFIDVWYLAVHARVHLMKARVSCPFMMHLNVTVNTYKPWNYFVIKFIHWNSGVIWWGQILPLVNVNCFLLSAVLGVTREATRSEIAKAYRSMAKRFHPDVQGPEVGKEEAERNFRRIATAYEVLRDDASREDYDYMVDHPEELYSHYYRYYRRRAAPNIDIRLILAVCITIISGIQYYSAWDRSCLIR